MKRVLSILGILAVVALIAAPHQADARPQYHKAFAAKFEKVAKEANEKKCAVCHGDEGKNKKQVSDFGKALAEALGAKNVKEEDKINEALDKVAKKEFEPGKTYGSLLEAGKLPAPYKAEEK